jgi:hypothetical protein
MQWLKEQASALRSEVSGMNVQPQDSRTLSQRTWPRGPQTCCGCGLGSRTATRRFRCTPWHIALFDENEAGREKRMTLGLHY